jgi:P4 family phage/plasmid primase-like protien
LKCVCRGPEQRNYIALQNGILDVDALLAGGRDVLLPHTPRWFSPVCLPFGFDPTADCPKWRAFLDRNLAGDQQKINLLAEWFGYILTFNTKLQRYLLMYGEGSNGKSVIIAAIEAVLGLDNISTVPMEQFGDKFRLAGTLGKLVNLMPEIGEVDKIAEAQLKAFVVGDPMEFERKFKTPFPARPTARIIAATNNPPRFSDKSQGAWRRPSLLRFTVAISKAEAVRGMDAPEWWHSQGEVPGILNWALAGLARLRQQGDFTEPQDSLEALNRMRLDANPARRYLSERYTLGKDSDEQPANALYRSYREWCGDCGHQPLADSNFGQEVFRLFTGVEKKKRGPRGAQYAAYIRLKQKADEDEISAN